MKRQVNILSSNRIFLERFTDIKIDNNAKGHFNLNVMF